MPEPPVTRLSQLPPVSILIPLSGKDFEAYDNYVSFCRQDYPDYQLVFGVNHPEDSSIPVIRQLMIDFPEKDIALVIDPGTIGENPKVNNLQNMLGKARHEVLVLVDSDIRVDADYLATVVSELADERIGMVTCLYRAGKAPNLAAKIEAVRHHDGICPGRAGGVAAGRRFLCSGSNHCHDQERPGGHRRIPGGCRLSGG